MRVHPHLLLAIILCLTLHVSCRRSKRNRDVSQVDRKREKLGKFCLVINNCRLSGGPDGEIIPSKQVVCLLSPQFMQCVGEEVKVAQPYLQVNNYCILIIVLLRVCLQNLKLSAFLDQTR